MVNPPKRTRARPKARPKFVVWDVTAPDDSVDFAQRMEKILHWRNLLEAAPSTLRFVERPKTRSYPRNRTPLFMPCGPMGGNFSRDLWARVPPIICPQLFNPKHGLSSPPNLFYLSAHGIPGFMFSEGVVLIGSSVLIGKPGSPKLTRQVPKPRLQWDSPSLKYVIFAACRQLDGRPQQALWARAMRGRHPLHGILGYHDTAPAAGACLSINKRFFQELRKGQTILSAWKNAHPRGHSAKSWAALIHESAVNDKATQWSQTGRLASSPSPSGIIKYFDCNYPNGRVVTEPIRYIDMWMQTSVGFGAGPEWPPWALVFPDQGGIILNFSLTEAARTRFEPGDRIRIAAAQVRPNYERPFDIRKLFSFVLPPSETMDQHKIKVLSEIHDRTRFNSSDFDTYQFNIPTRGSPEATRMRSWYSMLNPRCIQMKVKVGNFSNGHLSLFYLMGQLKKANGKVFGIPERIRGEKEEKYLGRLADDFQFAVFCLWVPS